jgi:hypothetical protein
MIRITVSLLVIVLLAACSNNTVARLHYMPTVQVQAVSVPAIGAVTAVDQRKEAPTRLATIMGLYGNPLKTLDTAKSVKDEVADAFIEGLRVRGLMAPDGQAPLRLELVVRKFDADMIIGRTARIDLTITVVDQAGRVVFQDSAVDSQSDFKFFQTGIFAEISDMKALSESVLNRTVDRMLDNSAFRSTVTGTLNKGS